MTSRTLPFRAGASRSTATLTVPAQRERTLRAVIYTRISSDDEGRELGVTRQREDGVDRVARQGYTLAPVGYRTERRGGVVTTDGEFRDNDRGASSKSRKSRPAFAAMLDAVRRGEVDVIIAYSMSRITRRPAEWETLIKLVEETGVRIETIVSGSVDVNTADGRMVLRMLASTDAGEAERVAERVARAHRQRVSEGRPNWRLRPFGHEIIRDEKGRMTRIAENTAEADAIRAAVDRIMRGTTTLGEIARKWNDAGLLTATGGQWRIAEVGALLRQARLAGLLEHRGEIVGESEFIPAIITPDVWYGLRARLDTNHGANFPRGQAGGGVRASALLTGEDSPARCGECGGLLTVVNLRLSRHNDDKTRCYKCKLGHIAIPADFVDQEVIARVVVAAAFCGVAILSGDMTPDTTDLRAREAALAAKLARFQGEADEDDADDDALLPLIKSTARKLAAVRQEIAQAESVAVHGPEDLTEILAKFHDLDLAEQRAHIRRLYSSIKVLRRYDDQDTESERVVTRFAGWLPADADTTLSGEVASIVTIDQDNSAAVYWKPVNGNGTHTVWFKRPGQVGRVEDPPDHRPETGLVG
ncbi:MAG TPA: recombinase family protein [Micromonosporaceae bacterium]|jgi:DNA invertase Pin-like site-specific DNA recombinase